MSTFAKKVTSAVVGLALVMTMLAPAAGVSAAYSSLDAANKLATLGIIVDNSGAPAAYRLADTITREELSKVIANLGGLTVTDANSVFGDTDFAPWAEKYAAALNVAGYAASNAYFNPKYNATKIEALKWVMEARTIATGTGDNWMAARVAGAVEAGIAESFSDYTANVTRGQVFIWAANAIDANEDVSVDDDLLCSILGTCDDTTDTTDDTTDTTDDTTTDVTVTGDLEVTLSPLSPTSGMIAAERDRTAFMAIDLTAGDEDVTLKQITLSYVGLSDSGDFDKLALYDGNEKVTRGDTKKFNSDEEVDLSFENDVVVQAGKTVTLVVSGYVAIPSTGANVAHQIAVTDVEANADVTIGTVKSVVFNVFEVSSVAAIDVDESSVDSTFTVGEESTISDFNLEETSDKEDVVVKSITFQLKGSADFEEDLSDIALMADGEIIASDLSVNSDDEIVVDLDFVIEQDSDVDFELVTVITGSVGDDIQADIEEVYALGADTGVIANISYDSYVPALADIDGSEINVSWDRSDTDEAKPDAEDVLVGTLTLDTDGDYTINNINVKVESTASSATGVLNILDKLELDGRSADSQDTSSTSATTVNFGFEDISLNNEEISLDLVADIVNEIDLNGESLKFTISVTSIDDEENDETYTGSAVTTVLSTNSFTAKTLDIESASLKLTQSKVSARDLVLGNGIEVVLFQGKLNVGDAANVQLNDVVLTGALKTSTGVTITSYDFEDIIDSATLNVGGVTADADVKSGSLEFNNTDIEIAAGADNVEVLVTAVLKDYDGVSDDDYFSFDVSSISAEDEDGEDLPSVSYTASAVADAKVTMTTEGTLTVKVVTNGDYDDEIDDVVLAGTEDVTLAELTLEAEEEDVDVNDLYLTIAGDFSDTLENARLMAGSTVLADGATITSDGSDTTIHFEDFTVEDTGSEIAATLVVDLNPITSEGGVVSAVAGDIIVELDSVDAEGASSNEDITAVTTGTTSSETVSVVPVLMTLAIDSTLSTSSSEATVEIILDYGDNDLDDDDVTLTQIDFAGPVYGLLQVRNDDEVTVASGSGASSLTLSTPDEINNGDIYTFKVDTSITADPEVRIAVNGFKFTVGTKNYTSLNDKILNLGTYNND